MAAEGTDPLARAREELTQAELVRSKGRSTPDTCPNCPPAAHVCHHEDEMRAWGDLPDITYTNEQAADRAVAALAAAGLLRDPAAETWTEYGRRTGTPADPPHIEGRALPDCWRKSLTPWNSRSVTASSWEELPGEPERVASALERLRADTAERLTKPPWRPVEDSKAADDG